MIVDVNDPRCRTCGRADVRLYGGVVTRETSRLQWTEVVDVYCNACVPKASIGFRGSIMSEFRDPEWESKRMKDALYAPLVGLLRTGLQGSYLILRQGHIESGCTDEEAKAWSSKPDADKTWRWGLRAGWQRQG